MYNKLEPIYAWKEKNIHSISKYTVVFLKTMVLIETFTLCAYHRWRIVESWKKPLFFRIDLVCCVVLLLLFLFCIYGNEFFVSSSTPHFNFHALFVCVCMLILFLFLFHRHENKNANEFLLRFVHMFTLSFSPCVHTERSNYRRIFSVLILWKKKKIYLHKVEPRFEYTVLVYDERIPKNLGQITIYLCGLNIKFLYIKSTRSKYK